jgi:hypothetical protein
MLLQFTLTLLHRNNFLNLNSSGNFFFFSAFFLKGGGRGSLAPTYKNSFVNLKMRIKISTALEMAFF